MLASVPAPDSNRYDVRCLISNGACTVTVSGDVDCLTAPDLQDYLVDVLGRTHLHEVEVDLSRVTFLDAGGMTALVIAHRTAASAGRVLCIRCGTARAVIRPLKITELWNALHIIE